MENYILKLADYSYRLASEIGFYFYLVPAVWLGVLFLSLLVGVVWKRFRYADKRVLSFATLSIAFSFIGTAFILKVGDSVIYLSMLAFALCFALCGAISIQSELKIRLTMKEKRLIGRLSSKKDDPKGNIKRVEIVESEREKQRSIEPNFNEITAIIDKLRREEITPFEEDELDKTEMDMEKFASREPTPFERRIFSDRLLKIVKMMSKYNIAK